MKGTLHLPGGAELMLARARLTSAKAAWTALAVSVLKREAGAGERVAPCLAELEAAHRELESLTRTQGEDGHE